MNALKCRWSLTWHQYHYTCPRLTFLKKNATENAYKSISEPLDFKLFLGGMLPDPPPPFLAARALGARNLPRLGLKSGYGPEKADCKQSNKFWDFWKPRLPENRAPAADWLGLSNIIDLCRSKVCFILRDCDMHIYFLRLLFILVCKIGPLMREHFLC